MRKAVENGDGSLTVTGQASDASQPDCDNEALEIAASWPYFEKRMRERLRAFKFQNALKRLKIVQSTKPHIAVLAAAALCLDKK